MNDRVRVYELARQMNLPNQDLIVALRELGYDIKSHSSTVDKHAVGLLIAHLGKKKQQEKAKPSKPAKAQGKVVPPPEPVIVKPRVLSRRKPTLTSEGVVTEIPVEIQPVAPVIEPQYGVPILLDQEKAPVEESPSLELTKV
ncbi:MAG: translation initiation factor IF-2 N-terminal domain-containing protein, partial [Candidatus Melainabacteria bacterium]|nr:translation initiation factor IF-2 N-terminal domain-containing protein [Candidatus Melainabacteria bacterium]